MKTFNVLIAMIFAISFASCSFSAPTKVTVTNSSVGKSLARAVTTGSGVTNVSNQVAYFDAAGVQQNWAADTGVQNATAFYVNFSYIELWADSGWNFIQFNGYNQAVDLASPGSVNLSAQTLMPSSHYNVLQIVAMPGSYVTDASGHSVPLSYALAGTVDPILGTPTDTWVNIFFGDTLEHAKAVYAYEAEDGRPAHGSASICIGGYSSLSITTDSNASAGSDLIALNLSVDTAGLLGGAGQFSSKIASALTVTQ
jgi:hypothetical protein